MRCSSSTSVSPMATLQSLALSSSVSHCSQQRRFPSGLISLTSVVCRSVCSSFNGKSLELSRPRWASLIGNCHTPRPITMMVKPTIQFIQGTDEQTIPDVRLTKSRDGTNGMAIFSFEQPSVFDSSKELGDITGFYMIDEEGVLQSVDVNAKFVNGKPARIEARYVMRSPREWDRFMRFMERYSNENNLQFIKK
ncbi:photosystem II reaction center PSB28 protein, chloroplastic-like [Telopea speciosissima]|uniref:photosystem II reaction center PSB28 protein, chloroplastic-like n=1 Tax=Telopea speciosissima TaxID=54955 RepID=UPI001CC76090|nr:photosystem II reaction center PSB28 protein, chloroplastic-like [Telopea speciosissima]